MSSGRGWRGIQAPRQRISTSVGSLSRGRYAVRSRAPMHGIDRHHVQGQWITDRPSRSTCFVLHNSRSSRTATVTAPTADRGGVEVEHFTGVTQLPHPRTPGHPGYHTPARGNSPLPLLHFFRSGDGTPGFFHTLHGCTREEDSTRLQDASHSQRAHSPGTTPG